MARRVFGAHPLRQGSRSPLVPAIRAVNSAPTLALVINTFNQPDYLARVLAAVARQTQPVEEVLLADDGSGAETRAVFASWADRQSGRTEHVWQAHEGFRRARILNQAIARAQSEYLVFLDGDTLPHPRFAEDHRAVARRGFFVQGHRALVEQRAAAWFGIGAFATDRRRALWSGQLRGWKHAFRWPRPLRRVRQGLRGIRGCNLALWRDDLVRVNGYNEAFVGWGREDSELAVRLVNVGIPRLDVRGWALCYHLWHPPASRTTLTTNDDLLAKAQREKSVCCPLGLDQYLVRERP
jgi:glycosyltransferase involved in cell wall biosynthesis